MTDGKSDVLVVEDDPEINELVGAYVQIAGFGYRRALGGHEGLRLAREHRPAMILLDVMLADVDGFEVCRRLKLDAATATIPVIMLTALDRDEMHQRGKCSGAAAYLTKPFDPDRLIETIQNTALKNGHAHA